MQLDLTKLVKQGGIVAGGILVGLGLWYVVLHYESEVEELRDHYQEDVSSLREHYQDELDERREECEEECETRIAELKSAHERLLRAYNIRVAAAERVGEFIDSFRGDPMDVADIEAADEVISAPVHAP